MPGSPSAGRSGPVVTPNRGRPSRRSPSRGNTLIGRGTAWASGLPGDVNSRPGASPAASDARPHPVVIEGAPSTSYHSGINQRSVRRSDRDFPRPTTPATSRITATISNHFKAVKTAPKTQQDGQHNQHDREHHDRSSSILNSDNEGGTHLGSRQTAYSRTCLAGTRTRTPPPPSARGKRIRAPRTMRIPRSGGRPVGTPGPAASNGSDLKRPHRPATPRLRSSRTVEEGRSNGLTVGGATIGA